ncbi:universal stress protein [Gracilibacillus oryzae]|uniref:Universal stress protein n=1 Tax=Gracilibacillus oryzae TaxID=1672701 RepID=A0A7C8GVN8_9BACI|nr:universal stress protein [Gracilibacillus oryzae]KAB8139305.1 universal stress protein [Gracilibacillus oryzae]
MYKRILLAADGSDHSVRAASHAINLTNPHDGQIDLVYVVDGKTSKEDVLHGIDKYEVKKEREAKLRPIVELMQEKQVACKTHFLHGEPGPTIVEFANSQTYDCVVVGSRGLNKLQTMILGSVSHKIAKRVHVLCSLLNNICSKILKRKYLISIESERFFSRENQFGFFVSTIRFFLKLNEKKRIYNLVFCKPRL